MLKADLNESQRIGDESQHLVSQENEEEKKMDPSVG